MATTYNKTVWVPGGPPGVSAPALNNIEQGIADAHAMARDIEILILMGAR